MLVGTAIFWMAIIFLLSGVILFDDKILSTNSTWSVLKMHFLGLSLNSCFSSRWRSVHRFSSCSCWSFAHMIMSSLTSFTPFHSDINYAGLIPYISRLYWKMALCIAKIDICLLSGCNRIWWYPSFKSILEKTVILWSSVRISFSLGMTCLLWMIAMLALACWGKIWLCCCHWVPVLWGWANPLVLWRVQDIKFKQML